MLNGFISILPLAAGAGAYGFAFGVLAAQAGFPWWGVGAMSFLVHAGSSQIVAVERFASDGLISGAVLAGLALNLRYLGILASLSPMLKKLPWPTRLLALHITGDENWALTLSKHSTDPSIDGYFLIGSGLAMITTWVASTSLGALIGTAIPDLAGYGLGFAFTAAFIAMARGMWKGHRDLMPWLCSFTVTVIMIEFAAQSAIAILTGSASGIILAGIMRARTPAGRT